MKPPPELIEIECGRVTVLRLQPSPVWKQLSSLTGNTLGDSFAHMIESELGGRLDGICLLVNFQLVQEFSGQMMAVIARLSKFAKEHQGSVALCRVPTWFREIMQVTKLDHLFRIFPDQTEAVNAMATEPDNEQRACAV